jgi:hypothetical protein
MLVWLTSLPYDLPTKEIIAYCLPLPVPENFKKLLIMLVSLLSDNVCLVNFSNFRSIQEIAPYAHHL